MSNDLEGSLTVTKDESDTVEHTSDDLIEKAREVFSLTDKANIDI